MKKVFGISVIVLAIDQALKLLVQTFLKDVGSVCLIPHFFELQYAENDGAAWSMFSGNRLFLIFMTFLFLGMIYYFFLKNETLDHLKKWGIGFLIGGILGNLFDRLFLGYVIDYLSFEIFGYAFPIFNFADTCIVLAILFLIIKSSEEVLPWKLKWKKH